MSEASFTAFRMYDKNGLQFTLSFPLLCANAAEFDDEDAQSVHHVIEVALRNGFTIRAPETVGDEKIETIGWLCRRSSMSNSGEEVPAIDIYPDSDNPEVKYKLLTIYLNKESDIEAFERATGWKLTDLPYYEGKPLERYEKLATKYLRQPQRIPLRVGLLNNPKYNPEETDSSKKKPRYLFNRWIEIPSNPTPRPSEAPKPERNESKPSTVTTTEKVAEDESSEHWANDKTKREEVAAAFSGYGVKGKEALTKAIGDVEKSFFKDESNITKLSETRIVTVEKYLLAMRDYYEAW